MIELKPTEPNAGPMGPRLESPPSDRVQDDQTEPPTQEISLRLENSVVSVERGAIARIERFRDGIFERDYAGPLPPRTLAALWEVAVSDV